MDPLKAELVRARQILDRMEGKSKADLDTYRALDALWQCLYFMMLEAGVVGGPTPEIQQRVASSLEKLMDEKAIGGTPAKVVEAQRGKHRGDYL